VNRFHRWYCRTGHWRHEIENEIPPWALQDRQLGHHAREVGPGLTTDVLAGQVHNLTALEIDADLALRPRERFAGTNVTFQRGDASAMPFASRTFSAAVSFTMLHHVPASDLRDRLLREVRRVLRPGASFVGSDSRSSLAFRVAHLGDRMVLADPESFGARLEAAGFDDVAVQMRRHAFRFRATAPLTASATT
jgi:SAM-dependent methyltransferase